MKIDNVVLRALSALLLGASAAIALVMAVALVAGNDPNRPDHGPPRRAVVFAATGALVVLPVGCIAAFVFLTPTDPGRRRRSRAAHGARTSVPACPTALPTTPPTTLPAGRPALTPESAAATSSPGLPSPTASVTFALSAREWTEAITYIVRRSPMRRQQRWVMALIVVAAIGWFNRDQLVKAPAESSTWFAIVASLVVVVAYVLLISLGIRWWERRNLLRLTRYPVQEMKCAPHTITLTRDALRVETPFASVRYPWRLLMTIVEHERFLFFLASPSEYECVPWSAFAEEAQRDYFVALAYHYFALRGTPADAHAAAAAS